MSEAEQAQEPEIVGPGEILKQAREKQGLSLEEMAGKLHLKSVAIAKLEADDYDENISLTFTKGYLKLYAKHIGVDEERVLAAFDKQNTKNKEPAKLQSFSRRVARQASDDRLMLVTYLIVAAVIAMVVVWWWQQSGTETVSTVISSGTDDQQIEDAKPVLAESQVPETGLVQNDIHSESTNVLAESSELEMDAVVGEAVTELADDASVSEISNSSSADLEPLDDAQIDSQTLENQLNADIQVPEEQGNQSALDEIQLVFTFAEDCWMNLTDANGEAIAYGVKKSGRVMTVAGVPPFEVTLGAPAVVQITYDGAPVDMSQFDAGRTAKFTLPLSG